MISIKKEKFIAKLIDEIENQNYPIFLTGPAGVGKTTLLKELKQKLNMRGHNVALCSTTGISAMNIGGGTIHKFMAINVQTKTEYIKYMKFNFQFSALKKRLAKFDIICIDEISMLRADQFELICLLLKEATGIDKLFGGKKIIFTGDFFQIPPVVKYQDVIKDQWIFNSPSWLNSHVKIYELTRVFRQENEFFVKCLNKIKLGIYDDKNVKKLFDYCTKNKPNNNSTRFFSTNEECDKYNEKKLNQIKSKEYVYKAVITGKRKQHNKDAIQRECIAKPILKLKKGAKVIIVFNDPKNRFVNGTKAEVVDLTEKDVTVMINDTNKIIKLKNHTWLKTNFSGRKIASFKQIPLILSYALTIHKSQGMTLNSIVIDCKNIFAYGQLYVAMSRVTDYHNLSLINFDKSKIIASKSVYRYYKSAKINQVYIKD